MSVQIVFLLIILMMITRVVQRWRGDAITGREFLFWLFFWFLAAALIAWPESLNRAADLLGVGRGVDVLIYLAVVSLFYLIFRLHVKNEQLERDITKLTRHLGLVKHRKHD